MRHITMGAVEAHALFAHRLHREHAPVLPAAELPGRLELHREFGQALGEPERRERAHHVRRDHDAGADFAQRGGLFVDGRLQPGAAQEQRGGEAAEAAADDRDAQGSSFRHGPATLSGALHAVNSRPFYNGA